MSYANAELTCRCQKVRGRVANPSPKQANRAICYCDDCQAFAHFLGRADLLDEHGGTHIVQVPPSSLSFDQGTEHIACVRLSPKGLYRWYARCCSTPIGNTMGARGVPFVGIVSQAFENDGRSAADYFGETAGAIFGQFAIGTVPESAVKTDWKLVLGTLSKMIAWKLRGRAWPHPFFERDAGEAKYPITVVEREQREALRKVCGPRPLPTQDERPAANA